MTTLAFDGRYLACDSQITHKCVKISSSKYYEGTTASGRKVVCMFAGTVESGRAGITALLADEDVCEALGEDTLLMVADKDGVRVYCEDSNFAEAGPYCDGSGSPFAYAGMALGLRADQAVALACSLDLHTSGPVLCWDTKTLRRIKPKPAPLAKKPPAINQG